MSGTMKRSFLEMVDAIFEIIKEAPHGISRSALQSRLGTNWYTIDRHLKLIEKIQQEYPFLIIKRKLYPQPDGSTRQIGKIYPVRNDAREFQTLADLKKTHEL